MRLTTFYLLTLMCFVIHAQETPKYDLLLMNNGEQRSGKVTEISDDEIKFAYTNEALIYTIKKADISKITFASGRIEFFNPDKTDTSGDNAQPADFHNKLAILPFAYIADQKDGSTQMPLKIQQECFSILNKKANNLQIQDIQTTNALLAKAGVNNNNIQGYTMGEICQILKVEYVIQGMITTNETSVVSSTTASGNSVVKESNKKNVIGKILNTTTSSTTSEKNYDTTVNMNIYDHNGQHLFGQEHNSFWPGIDAYRITLNYLLKRTPVYGK
ncbi:hypothetical protein [Sinomicrobium weinanense]|uniref:Uncharacterized protein n=1 Tax=Sinomicrobium weinanense TaxID=2842200 RepID=A0A926JUE1_9FLAO|nr:hypothetical protein [Sinomicrobium weinanense]MBC9797504.1 hypothetical protein [Sinomicrobium weinanense]MBU3122210.1 hypothetical protein [Sinomicrobium weinanense]